MQVQLSNKDLYLRLVTPAPIETPEALFAAATKEHRSSEHLWGLMDGLWTGWCIGAGEKDDDGEVSIAMNRLRLLAVGKQALETMEDPESFDKFCDWFGDLAGEDYHLAKLFGVEWQGEVQARVRSAKLANLKQKLETANALQPSKLIS